MSFTYRDELETSRDKVRFWLGDITQDQGKRPNGKNFSDNEIAYLLSSEGDNVEAAVAAGFEALSNDWQDYAVSLWEEELKMSAEKVSGEYAAKAEKWRRKSGRDTGVVTGFSEHQNIFHLGYSQ